MLLANQVAIVTDGGGGIGRTIALRLAQEGAAVLVAGPHEPELRQTADEIRVLGRPALAVAADVRVEEQGVHPPDALLGSPRWLPRCQRKGSV